MSGNIRIKGKILSEAKCGQNFKKDENQYVKLTENYLFSPFLQKKDYAFFLMISVRVHAYPASSFITPVFR